MERKVYFACTHGHYNLCSNEKSWLLALYTPFGNVSEHFDEEPTYGDSVEDALYAIECRVNSWLFSSGRDERLATIAAIKANLPECELLYAQRKLGLLRDQEKRLSADISSTERLVASLQSEIADAARALSPGDGTQAATEGGT